MNIRLFTLILICTAAPAIAFPLGVRVGSGWGGKTGPAGSAIGSHATELHPARVISPGTLDGQSVPGHAGSSGGPGRDLSPVYPTSPTAEGDISASQGLAPAAQASAAEARPDGSRAAEPDAAPRMIGEPHGPDFDPGQGSGFDPGQGRRDHVSRREHRGGEHGSARHSGPRRIARLRSYPVARSRGPSNPVSAFAGLFFR